MIRWFKGGLSLIVPLGRVGRQIHLPNVENVGRAISLAELKGRFAGHNERVVAGGRDGPEGRRGVAGRRHNGGHGDEAGREAGGDGRELHLLLFFLQCGVPWCGCDGWDARRSMFVRWRF